MLSDRHAAFLAARAVTGPVVQRRGYATVTDPAELAAAGFPQKQAQSLVPGLLIPRYGLDGRPSWPKFRPDPEGRNGPPQAKYVSPGGSWNFLDALPGTNLRGDLWVSAEGFIKSDSLTAAGLQVVVAFDGVYGWMSQREVVLGLEALARPGRWFHVVCDSDIDTNPRVAGAMFRLAGWLRRRDCRVRVLHPPGAEKVGVDDFLAGGGDVGKLVSAERPTLAVRR
ncbi:MAG: DUF3854 domain-containing protein, partial [Actinobacteria bacterium]|nr:DUF3854 domain-containing protein [Actinomycetota bacterium]